MHQLKYRLSRTRKPKSYPSSNTKCPITPKSYRDGSWGGHTQGMMQYSQERGKHDQLKSDFPAPESQIATLPATRFVHPHTCSQPTKIPAFPHQKAKKPPFQQHAVSYNPQPPLEPRPGITKPPGPNWGRAAVAVALGFEPRVAVTPHSISSAAPSAARTRYLTRILYYTNPPTTQIDHPRWEQSHTPKPRVRAPTRTSRCAIASNSPRPPRPPRPPRTSGSPGKA